MLSVQQTMFKFLICPIQNGEYITPAGHFMPVSSVHSAASIQPAQSSNSNHQNSKDNITYIEPQTIELQRADGPNGSASQQQQQHTGGVQEQHNQGGHHAANQQQAQNQNIRTSESEQQQQQQYLQAQEMVPVSQSDLAGSAPGATSEPQQQQQQQSHPSGQVQFGPDSPANSQSQEMAPTTDNANNNQNHSPISTENDENWK